MSIVRFVSKACIHSGLLEVAPHHTAHYGGALKGYKAADSKLETATKDGAALGGDAFGALKRMISSKGNSVVLHELYFDSLTPNVPALREDVREAIA